MKHAEKKGTLFFIILGIFSVIWFLIRVIPKPSRISYPCQRMAAANTVAFLTWLTGAFFSMSIIKMAQSKLKDANTHAARILLMLVIASGITTFIIISFGDIMAAIKSPADIFTPTDLNQPIGTATGIFPGRVSWSHDQDAITYNPSAANGYWWDDNNTNPKRVDDMFTHGIDGITGATRTDYAWDNLFRYANQKMGKPDFGYSPGEKIAIKVNLVMGLAGGKDNASCPGPSPQVLTALLKGLIEEVHVPGELITIYDASARIPDYIMKPFKNNSNPEFQKIKFVGNPKYVTASRYLPVEADMNSKIYFADTSVTDVYLVKSLTEADYVINLANLKGHTLAGVTFCAKNLYGSIFIPAAVTTVTYGDGFGPKNSDANGGLHKCIAAHDYQEANIGFFPQRANGTYNYLVDLLGHPEVYNKTILYIVDGLYGGKQQNQMDKFTTFNNHYTASIFMSQDPIALESVCLDFLRSEPICAVNVYGNVDNYLHEAALAGNPPSGTVYNPGGGSSHLQSLGVHEHWNSFADKQYSKNLGRENGIELVTYKYPYEETNTALSKTSESTAYFKNYPNPFSETTTIAYSVEKTALIEIGIYNDSGKLIETLMHKHCNTGHYQIVWNAANMAPGKYHCRIKSNESEMRTISLLKIK
jgi:hypothetical protein